MVTFVGTQEHFGDSLTELVELEYAALDAYEAAVERLQEAAYKEKLMQFQKDHEQHIEKLCAVLRKNNCEIPEKGMSGKQVITTGKVLLANMIGDKTILQAIKSNEIDTHTAYQRMNAHQGKWTDAQSILEAGLFDETRHLSWLEDALS